MSMIIAAALALLLIGGIIMWLYPYIAEERFLRKLNDHEKDHFCDFVSGLWTNLGSPKNILFYVVGSSVSSSDARDIDLLVAYAGEDGEVSYEDAQQVKLAALELSSLHQGSFDVHPVPAYDYNYAAIVRKDGCRDIHILPAQFTTLSEVKSRERFGGYSSVRLRHFYR